MKNYLTSVPLILAALSVAVYGQTKLTISGLQEDYLKIARTMDSSYYAAGTKVDIAGYDLEELERQGKTVPSEIKNKVAVADKTLRAKWLLLENERVSIEKILRIIPDIQAANELRIENLTEGGAGENGWFAVRQASIVCVNGENVTIKPSIFKGGAFRENYSYQCQASPCSLIYGRGSRTCDMSAWFDMPSDSARGVRLIISGLDQDKPGQTCIRILLNGVKLFEGENGFKKNGWSEKSYIIPDAAWSKSNKQTKPETINELMNAWKKNVDTFSGESAICANEIDGLTRPLRKGLVWKKRDYAKDWWKHGFMRGMCLESDTNYPPDEYGRPWFPDNQEYIAKAFASIGVNMIYLYPTKETVPFVKKENEKTGTPVLECYWMLAHPFAHDKTKTLAFYFNSQAVADEVEKNIRNYDSFGINFRGITVDEPRIGEETGYGKNAATNPEIIKAWRNYLKSRGTLPIAKSLAASIKTRPILAVKSDYDRVAWMEWQYFTMEFFTDFYARVYDSLDKKGIFAFFVVQDYLAQDPQVAAYTHYGARLPIIATDLYNNAGVNEAFGMDLLRSVAKGKAILLPGSGYSAKTPVRFYRTLANSMLRADGVVQWIYTYSSKYRAPYFFIRYGLKDDRGREALDNWKPEYWDIQAGLYRGMAKAEKYLTDTQSTAQIAVLYSMRSIIAESAHGGIWSNTGYRNNMLVYNAMIGLHRPFEACMVEGLTQEKLKRYKVMILVDAPALSPEECELLRRWVRDGGVLVAGANVSGCDQWGRTQKDYALAEIFGVHFERMDGGVSEFSFIDADNQAIRVEYDKTFHYAKVRPDKANVLAKWENQSPALLINSVGLGNVYFLTAKTPGFYNSKDDPFSGLYDETKPGFPKLFRQLASRHSEKPVAEIIGAPKDVEVQIRQKGDVFIIHLLDWREERTISGLKLKVNKPGTWKISYPMTGHDSITLPSENLIEIQSLYVHSMILLERK